MIQVNILEVVYRWQTSNGQAYKYTWIVNKTGDCGEFRTKMVKKLESMFETEQGAWNMYPSDIV